MHDLHQLGNRIEAVLWFGFAVVFGCKAVKAWNSSAARCTLLTVLAMAFAVFGLSDLIESGTGAWWRPWWLLAMKAGCIVVFVVCTWVLVRRSGKAQAVVGDVGGDGVENCS
jgi:hypothetical protein